VVLFIGTLFIRQYLHYWILALPFLALFACREFSDDRDSGPDGSGAIPEKITGYPHAGIHPVKAARPAIIFGHAAIRTLIFRPGIRYWNISGSL